MMKKMKQYRNNGAALILVVVVTVLLAVIGVMFMMTSRVSEMETVAVTDQRDLKAAVQTVVSRIDEVLVKDLFGNDGQMVNADSASPAEDETSDFPLHNNIGSGPDGVAGTTDDVFLSPGVTWLTGLNDDVWLASLEPVYNDNGTASTVDDYYEWPHVSDLWGTLNESPESLYFQRYTQADDATFFAGVTTSYIWSDDTVEQVSAFNVQAKVIAPRDGMGVSDLNGSGLTMPYGARADADGDGVADSRWVKVPGLSTSRGKDVFAAVRIIDNCAMLNLNAAHCFYQEPYDEPGGIYVDAAGDPVSPFEKPWFQDRADYLSITSYHNNLVGTGRYLTEINYLPFLRGSDLNGSFFGAGAGDDWYDLMTARGFYNVDAGGNIIPFSFTPREGQNAFMQIESINSDYHFFDIGDELELRNRYLVTSKVESRFEQDTVANFSLDAGGGMYGSLETPVDDTTAFNAWKIKVDPANFDNWSGFLTVTGGAFPYRYDRRHVCTFYSFDRNFRKGGYPLLQADFAALGLTQQQIEAIEPVFRPLGAVTTNIENLDAAQPYNNTETRKGILHLLYALREYYYDGTNPNEAALKSAQVVANIIDYSDGTGPNGPFADAAYGTQANVDCTFVTEQVIEDMIAEVSGGLLPVGSMPFGLNATDIVFGYERQPFISEIYANWDEGPDPVDEADDSLVSFAIELINPYHDSLGNSFSLEGWQVQVGSDTPYTFPLDVVNPWAVPSATVAGIPGRYVLRGTGAVSVSGVPIPMNPVTQLDRIQQLYYAAGGSIEIKLLRPAPANSGVSFIVVDSVSNMHVRSILNQDGEYSLQRDDDDWKFIYNEFAPAISVTGTGYQLGTPNDQTTATTDFFQMAVPDDQYPLARWHDLEVLSLYGNEPESSDPNVTDEAITVKISNQTPKHFDLAGTSSDLLDYLCTINRPDKGTLPGRININTAPVHVIAAAIPPSLVDPNMANPLSLNLAQQIVANRPYQNLSQLLTVPGFSMYDNQLTGYNVGQQSIQGDIEERDWILSNLANKFTVRSDVFTAYILVRLGENGPQRRMIAIFDRSGVWSPTDRPKLVALHPVPDPR